MFLEALVLSLRLILSYTVVSLKVALGLVLLESICLFHLRQQVTLSPKVSQSSQCITLMQTGNYITRLYKTQMISLKGVLSTATFYASVI